MVSWGASAVLGFHRMVSWCHFSSRHLVTPVNGYPSRDTRVNVGASSGAIRDYLSLLAELESAELRASELLLDLS